MVDPVSIALAIAGTKKLLQSANDIKDIAGGLDKLFHAASEKPKPKKKPEPKSRTAQILRMRMGETKEEAYAEDSDSISAVANDVLEKQKQAAAIASLAKEINKKFQQPVGQPTTWDQILAEQAKRVEAKKIQRKKNKEKAAEQKEIDDKYWDNVFAIIRNIGILVLVSIICVILGYLMTTYGCKEAVC